MSANVSNLGAVPNWTEDTSEEAGGRDFLGLQSVGEAILDDLLPGLTNSTVHPRYYAFFTWAFKVANDTDVAAGKALTEHLFRYETALIYAAQATHGDGILSVVGIRDVRTGPHRWTGESRRYRVDKAAWSHRVSAFSSPYYRPSFTSLRLLRVNSDGTVSLLPEGQRLAEAFENQLAGSAAVRMLSKTGSRPVGGEVLKQLHDDFCPCAVRNRGGTDRPALIEVLFRFERSSQDPVRRKGEDARRSTLGYLLHLISKCGRDAWDDEDALRTLIYYWQSPSHAYVPEPGLRQTAEAWRVFQAQQYERYALETLWAAFLRILGQRVTLPFDLSAVGGAIASELMKSRFYQDRGLRLPSDLSGATLEDLSAAILKSAVPERRANGLTCFETSWRRLGPLAKGSEAFWVSEIQDALWNTGNAYWAFGAAVGLLVTLWLRWRCYAAGASGAEFLKVGGRLRLSLAKAMDDFESRRNESLPRVFSWLLEEYVVGQHLRVAAHKLASEGIDTFWFYASEEGYRVHPDRDVTESKPSYSGPKLWAARECLHDLNLIEVRGDSSCRCTREGRATLEKVLKLATM